MQTTLPQSAAWVTPCAPPPRAIPRSSAQTREQILGALRLLVDAGGVSGILRSGVDPKDVMRVINGIQWREGVGRMLELVIDGLRYGVPDRRQQPAH